MWRALAGGVARWEGRRGAIERAAWAGRCRCHDGSLRQTGLVRGGVGRGPAWPSARCVGDSDGGRKARPVALSHASARGGGSRAARPVWWLAFGFLVYCIVACVVLYGTPAQLPCQPRIRPCSDVLTLCDAAFFCAVCRRRFLCIHSLSAHPSSTGTGTLVACTISIRKLATAAVYLFFFSLLSHGMGLAGTLDNWASMSSSSSWYLCVLAIFFAHDSVSPVC